MLYQLSRLPTDTLSIILYTDSSSLEYIAQSIITRNFDISGRYTRNVSTEKELLAAKSIMNAMPLEGKKWLLMVDADKIDPRTLEKSGATVYDSCLIVYRTNQYRVFKALSQSKFAGILGRYCFAAYGGLLHRKDIAIIADYYSVTIPEKQAKFLESKYSRNAAAICTLCANLKAGYEVYENADIVDLIGLGDINVASFIISLLTSRPKNPKGRRAVIKSKLVYLDTLASQLTYATVQNFITDTLDGFIDIKLAEIAGQLNIVNGFSAPEGMPDKRANRFNRLMRHYNILRNELSLEYLLYARSLYKKNSREPRLAIMEWVFNLYSFIGTRDNVNEKRVQELYTAVSQISTFNMDDYNAYGELSKTAGVLRKIKPKPVSVKEIIPPVTIEPVEDDEEDYLPASTTQDMGLAAIQAMLFGGKK